MSDVWIQIKSYLKEEKSKDNEQIIYFVKLEKKSPKQTQRKSYHKSYK